MVHYVDEVVAVTVMCVLLFVLHVCLLRECDRVRLTAMLVWGLKNTIFNNCHYRTNIPTIPHTVTTTEIKQTCTIYINILCVGI